MLNISFLLSVIKKVLNCNNAEFAFDTDANTEYLYAFSKAHHLAGFLGFCAEFVEQLPPELAKKFLYEKNRSIAREATQQVVISAFLDKMEEKKLFCMPLKGYQIKNMYPHPAMRYMTDTDILIDSNDIEKITQIMKDLGLEYDHETLHEVIFTNRQLNVELHKTLVPSKLGKSYDYYADYLKFTQDVEGRHYVKKMSDEDLYVYSVDHIARHYIEGGTGIKSIVDIYIMSQKELDWKYIECELSKLGLYKFGHNLKYLSKMWFSEEAVEIDESICEMADFIFKSGAFGSNKNRTAAGVFLQEERECKKQLKLTRLISQIFVSPEHIKMLYPVVRRHRWLYPVYVFVRIGDILFKRKGSIKKVRNMMSVTNSETEKLKQHFEKVGLSGDL